MITHHVSALALWHNHHRYWHGHHDGHGGAVAASVDHLSNLGHLLLHLLRKLLRLHLLS